MWRSIALASPLLLPAVQGRCPDWSLAFGRPTGPRVVRTIATFDDGSGPATYVGGTFPSGVGGFPARNVARWDGVRWTDVGGGLGGSVSELVVFDDGLGPRLYAVGGALTAGGSHHPAARIARWDGTSWSLVDAPTPILHAAFVWNDGSGDALYVGGNGGSVARWDGATWTHLGSGGSGQVLCFAAFDDGSGEALYAGGSFTSLAPGTTPGLARWNGTHWSSVGTGLPPVQALAVFDAGAGPRLYASHGGQALAVWDGAQWSVLDHSAVIGPVLALATHDDGAGARLIAGGALGVGMGGGAPNTVASWDGNAWTRLAPWPSFGGYVQALHSSGAAPDARLLAAGEWKGGALQAGLVGAYEGSQWSILTGQGFGYFATVGGQRQGRASAFAEFDGGSGAALYVGGFFQSAGPTLARNLASWDGSGWTAVGSGTDKRVEALTVFDDGGGDALYLGGWFTEAGGVPASYAARFAGGSFSALGSGPPWPIGEFAVAAIGGSRTLFASGPGDTFQGAPFGSGGVVRWSGATWEVIGDVVGADTVHSIVAFDDGGGTQLAAAGSFATLGGVAASNVASWDGIAWSPLGAGIGAEVESLIVFDAGEGAGPALHAAARAPVGEVLRWTGSTWTRVGGSLSDVRALAVHDDGVGFPELYASDVQGVFRLAGGVWSRLGDPSLDFADPATAFGVFGDGSSEIPSLFANATIHQAGLVVASGLARWEDACARESARIAPYCRSKPSSLGCLPHLDVQGRPSVRGNEPFEILVRDAVPGQSALLVHGSSRAGLSFHGGALCVKAPFERLLPATVAKSHGPPPCPGELRSDFKDRIQNGADPALTAGRTVFLQCVQQDPADPSGFGDSLTNGIRFTILP